MRSIPAGLSLRENFSWTFAGNVIYAGCQWGVLVVLAKLGSPEMVGQFALGLAIVTPVIMLTNLQLRNVQATDAKREYLFGDYLGLRLVTTALALMIIVGIVLVASYRLEIALVILAVGIVKSLEAVSNVFYGLLQQHERMDRIARSMMLKGPLSLAALCVGVYLTGSVLWGVVGMILARASVLMSYDIHSGALMMRQMSQPVGLTHDADDQRTMLHPRWEARTLTRLAWLALPLGVVMALISLKTNIPRYFIEGYLGEHGLGIFAAIAYLQQAGTTLVGALGQSAMPRLAKHYAMGKGKAFRVLLLKLAGIGALLGGAGVLLAAVGGREILTLLYSPEYAERDLFVWLMVGAGISYIAAFMGYGMMATRYFLVQVPLFVFVTGTAALACLWLIPANGLRGAAMALIVANSVQACGALAITLYALRALRRHAEEAEYPGPRETESFASCMATEGDEL
jgi:O-antigen/teichoic acid export membrane protein